MPLSIQAWCSGGYVGVPWVLTASRVDLAAVERVTRVLPSSSFLGPGVDDTSITEPSTTDSIGLLPDVLPVFLDVPSEVSVDKIPCVRELTSVRVFLLEPTLWAMAGTPIVVLGGGDEFTDSDGFARFAGDSTLVLDTSEFTVLNAPVSLDGKLMVSAIVSFLKVKSFWTTIPISIS